MKTRHVMTAAAVVLAVGATAPAQETAPLIPRSVLFGNPTRATPRISPDGRMVSYLAPVNGVLNIWIAPSQTPAAGKPVTNVQQSGIRVYQWAYTSQHILYTVDVADQGSTQVMCVDLTTGATRPLTPATMTGDDGQDHPVTAQIQHLSPRYGRDVVVSMNGRDAQARDLFVVNIDTGERVQLQLNEGFAAMYVDDDYSVRLATRMMPDGSQEIVMMGEDGQWAPFTTVPAEDTYTTGVIGFDKTGAQVYMIDSRGKDTAVLKAINMASGAVKILAKDRDADISGGVLIHPTERTVQAASATFQRRTWQVVDADVRDDFKYLETVADGELSILSRTNDDKQWIVAYELDNGPVRYYRYDRPTQTAQFMFSSRPELEGLSLARMYTDRIKSRDRQMLVTYYTLPDGTDPRGRGRPTSPLPMVVWVHGGPWWRDTWGFDPVHQWLANRGYAVMSVNFRGSTGFGKKFMAAGNREWGGKMQSDLVDAVEWAVDKKIADPSRIAIMGGSYGGYAAVMGLCLTPQQFACAVDVSGPVNLVSFLESMPDTWPPTVELWSSRVGDIRTDEGRAALREHSPVTCAVDIRRPLLLASGIQDQRIDVAETQSMVDTLQKQGVPVTWLIYPDEGHGLARMENRVAFFAVTESFLAQHLGGRAEPIGHDLERSSVEIPIGGEALASVPDR